MPRPVLAFKAPDNVTAVVDPPRDRSPRAWETHASKTQRSAVEPVALSVSHLIETDDLAVVINCVGDRESGTRKIEGSESAVRPKEPMLAAVRRVPTSDDLSRLSQKQT